MSELMLIDDYKTDCTTYEGFGCINDVRKLVEERTLLKKQIVELHSKVMGNRYGEAFSYFVTAAGQNSLHETLRIERFFELDRAICALDQDFWNRLIDVINVKNFMPAEKRDQWFDDLDRWRKADRFSLQNVRPLPFELETVLTTAKTLSDERKDFFSEMVDGVFKKLSPTHFTNKSEGFSMRMIVANAMPSIDRHYDNQEYINDLRKIVGLMFKREGAESVSSHNLFEDLKKYYGEWVPIDGDTIFLKPHKNGTVHVKISQDIADALNVVLAYKYPNIIPLKKKRGEKLRGSKLITEKQYLLFSEILPFSVCNYFGELARSKSGRSVAAINVQENHEYFLPGNYLHSPTTNITVQRIFLMLGGRSNEEKKNCYRFDFDPVPVFESIFINGTLPDQDSHQFYPTKGDLRRSAVDLAELKDSHSVLDPSAGFGDFLELLPRKVGVTAIEIHPVAAATLRAKGYNTIQGDFLKLKPTDTGLFDRVLMNPPYSEGRWSRHLFHALSFIKPGGKLVAVLPSSASSSQKFDAIGEGYGVSFSDPYTRAFEGTTVSVVIITIDRHEK
ncbi:TPA: DUF4942 domain-containing protein [Escherichia coli]|uniref:class I SAM-dependent methyltransferase n=1 Tax=Enterobacteriaceae TaxID=543 RepID=UPI0011424C8C|nr:MULTISPECIES: class I SAM-dependent methyltransferase [Enterobacteriaceae]MBC9460778.1 DUF4942 domain-containing protein [Escherichia coli]MBX4658814.1 hypothetical protein [Klebsiella michiganensis]TYY50694.1 DUF4942 domain-containing protein [Klebsiella pneumoniae]BBA64845.1 putative DNA methylase [Escherichia coli]HAG8204989.1 DUF4942 domain-containing protein [Escherichia coli]